MAEREDQPRRGAEGATQDVKQHLVSGAEALRHGAEARADEWKSGVGVRAGHVAEALHSAGESLRGKEDWLAEAADALGRNLAQFSDAARDKPFTEIRDDLERVARHRPALFLGAAVAAGVAIGRVLRSSARADGGGSPRGAAARGHGGAGGGRPARPDPGGTAPTPERPVGRPPGSAPAAGPGGTPNERRS